MSKYAPYTKWLALAVIGATLTGCAAGVIGGGAVAASVADRRSGGSQADDEVMEQRIKSKAQAILRQQNAHSGFKPTISVTSYNRRILLTGQVASEADSQLAYRIAQSEQSALSVYNYITVTPASRTMLNVSQDTAITARVRASLLALSRHVYPGHVKVVTYGGITYVMGILSPAQQQLVTQTVSTTPGVLRVVTLYEKIASTNYYQ